MEQCSFYMTALLKTLRKPRTAYRSKVLPWHSRLCVKCAFQQQVLLWAESEVNISGTRPPLKDTKHRRSAPFIWLLWTEVSIEVWSFLKRFYNGVQLRVCVCVCVCVCVQAFFHPDNAYSNNFFFTQGGTVQKKKKNRAAETKKPAHG